MTIDGIHVRQIIARESIEKARRIDPAIMAALDTEEVFTRKGRLKIAALSRTLRVKREILVLRLRALRAALTDD